MKLQKTAVMGLIIVVVVIWPSARQGIRGIVGAIIIEVAAAVIHTGAFSHIHTVAAVIHIVGAIIIAVERAFTCVNHTGT